MPKNLHSLSEPFEPSDLPSGLQTIPKTETERTAHLFCAEATVASYLHPKESEDSFFHSESNKVMAVFDGVGGGAMGDLASRTAADELKRERMDENLAQPFSPRERERMERIRLILGSSSDAPLERKEVEAAVADVFGLMQWRLAETAKNDVIRKGAIEKFSKEKRREYDPSSMEDVAEVDDLVRGMGTTATVVKCWKNTEGKAHITVGNVGDSRAYMLREGVLYPLTRDQSWVRLLIDEGVIPDDQDVMRDIDLETVDFAADRNVKLHSLAMWMRRKRLETVKLVDIRNVILQTLSPGDPSLKPDVKTYNLLAGDVTILTSDGVHDNLTDEEMREIAVQHANDPTTLAQAMKEKAFKRSMDFTNDRAKPDDITVVVGRWDI